MLTYRDEDGCVRIEGCDNSNMEDMLRRCIDRLYEYESVGLTPEGVRKALRELKALKKAEEGTAQAVDCAAVAELFNGICAALPKVKGLSSARRSGIYTADARLRRAGVTWEEFFRRVASSGFLCGKTGWRGCGFASSQGSSRRRTCRRSLRGITMMHGAVRLLPQALTRMSFLRVR